MALEPQDELFPDILILGQASTVRLPESQHFFIVVAIRPFGDPP